MILEIGFSHKPVASRIPHAWEGLKAARKSEADFLTTHRQFGDLLFVVSQIDV
jgi:hypothetical protein